LMFWSASERPAAVIPWWDTLFAEDIVGVVMWCGELGLRFG
jgi:hypothetical protein